MYNKNAWSKYDENQLKEVNTKLSNPNLRGQAQVEGYMAGKVLLNSLLENQDTLPHEYAHHYIAWFRNSDIVQKGIKLFGSEEQLVQAIGENSVKATKWYNRFFNWIKGLFNDKQKTLNSLTKSFLSGENIGNGKEVSNEIHNQAIDTINKNMGVMTTGVYNNSKITIEIKNGDILRAAIELSLKKSRGEC